MHYEYGGEIYKVHLEQRSGNFKVRIGDKLYDVSMSRLGDGKMHIKANGLPFYSKIASSGQKRFIFLDGETYHLKRIIKPIPHDHVEGEILSPIGGKIIKIFVAEGDIVEENQDLLIVESMKMEYRVKAPFKATVMRVKHGEGTVMNTGEVLLDLERIYSDNQAEW